MTNSHFYRYEGKEGKNEDIQGCFSLQRPLKKVLKTYSRVVKVQQEGGGEKSRRL